MFELFKKSAAERPHAVTATLRDLQVQMDEALERHVRAGYHRGDLEALLDALPAADRAAITSVAHKLAAADRDTAANAAAGKGGTPFMR